MKLKVYFLVFVLTLCSCVSRGPALPEISGPRLSGPDFDGLVAGLLLKTEEIKTLKILSRSKSVVGEQSDSLRHVFLYSSPGRFRMELLPLNTVYTLGLMVVSGDQFSFFDAGSRVVYTGKPDIRTIRTATGIPAEVDDFAAFLSGRVPERYLREIIAGGQGGAYAASGQPYVQFVAGNFKYYGVIDRESLLVTYMELRDQFNDRLVATGKFGDFRESGGISVPGKAELHFPEQDLTLSLNFTSLIINQEIDDSKFSGDAPGDYEVKKIG